MDIYNGDLSSTGTTAITALDVLDDAGTKSDPHKTANVITHIIKVISGTVKFGVGGVRSSAYGYTSADNATMISCRKGNLYCKQASNGDTFVINTAV